MFRELRVHWTNILTMYVQRWDVRLTLDQVYELADRVPDLEMVMPQVGWGAQVTYEGKEQFYPVQGVTEVFPQLRDHALYAGRFFTAVEDEISRPVAVIGWQVMQDLFAGRNPVGKNITINMRTYEIIGFWRRKAITWARASTSRHWSLCFVAQRGAGTNRLYAVYMKAKSKDAEPVVPGLPLCVYRVPLRSRIGLLMDAASLEVIRWKSRRRLCPSCSAAHSGGCRSSRGLGS